MLLNSEVKLISRKKSEFLKLQKLVKLHEETMEYNVTEIKQINFTIFSHFGNDFIQFVNEAKASTIFPACSLRVRSALSLEISISLTINSTSSFLMETLANSFSRAIRFAASSACLLSRKYQLCFEIPSR